MRLMIATFVLALGACDSQTEPRQQSGSGAPAPAAAKMPVPAAAAAAAPMMAIPDDPAALKRLEEMGYTIHKEEGHLHAPGVEGCPAMREGAAM